MNIITLLPSNQGSKQSALGISSELKNHFERDTEQAIKTQSLEKDEFHRLSDKIGNKPTIIVTSSLEHIDEIEKLGLSNEQSGANVRIVWQSHQLPEIGSKEMNILKRYVHDIVIPRHEETYAQQAGLQDRAIFTSGVPHTLTKDAVKDALADYSNARFLSVMNKLRMKAMPGIDIAIMGGDFETRNGTVVTYDDKHAYMEGYNIAARHKQSGRVLLATNGPRTGKSSIENAHRGNTELDEASRSYKYALEANGLTSTQDFEFFDFRFKDEGGVDSVLRPALALLDDQSTIYCEGMSITMAYEILAVKPEGARLTLVDLGEPMLDSHRANMAYMNKMGWADILHANGQLTPALKTTQPIVDPSVQAACLIGGRVGNHLSAFGIQALKAKPQ